MAFNTLLIPYSHSQTHMQLSAIAHIKTRSGTFNTYDFVNACRSYYRCTQDNCRVKKRVERLAEDPRMVITTYEGRHIHSPSHDMEDSQTPSQLNNFFW